MRKFLEFAEQVFTVLSLLHYTSGPLPVIASGGASEGNEVTTAPDNGLIWLLFLFNYGVTFFLLVLRWKKVVYVLSKDRFIWVLVGIAVASILWSFSPEMTLRRVIALVGTSSFGFYLATRYSLKQLLQLLSWTFGLAIVLSLFFVVALPKYGIMGGVHAAELRGIYPHKNTLGKVMVPSGIVFFLLAIDDKRHRLILWCGFIFSLVLLVLSNSKTSLINLITLLAALPIYRILRWRYKLMIPALIAIATVGGSLSILSSMLFMDNPNVMLNLIGKDITLSGRTELWSAVVNKIWQRPWLGYGYAGFWLDLNGESADVLNVAEWNAPNSHNGLLDLWLDLGFLGVSIFLMGFWTSLARGLTWMRLSRTSESLFPLMYMTYIVLANLTESTLLVQNQIFWVLYVAVAYLVLLQPEESKNKQL